MVGAVPVRALADSGANQTTVSWRVRKELDGPGGPTWVATGAPVHDVGDRPLPGSDGRALVRLSLTDAEEAWADVWVAAGEIAYDCILGKDALRAMARRAAGGGRALTCFDWDGGVLWVGGKAAALFPAGSEPDRRGGSTRTRDWTEAERRGGVTGVAAADGAGAGTGRSPPPPPTGGRETADTVATAPAPQQHPPAGGVRAEANESTGGRAARDGRTGRTKGRTTADGPQQQPRLKGQRAEEGASTGPTASAAARPPPGPPLRALVARRQVTIPPGKTVIAACKVAGLGVGEAWARGKGFLANEGVAEDLIAGGCDDADVAVREQLVSLHRRGRHSLLAVTNLSEQSQVVPRGTPLATVDVSRDAAMDFDYTMAEEAHREGVEGVRAAVAAARAAGRPVPADADAALDAAAALTGRFSAAVDAMRSVLEAAAADDGERLDDETEEGVSLEVATACAAAVCAAVAARPGTNDARLAAAFSASELVHPDRPEEFTDATDAELRKAAEDSDLSDAGKARLLELLERFRVLLGAGAHPRPGRLRPEFGVHHIPTTGGPVVQGSSFRRLSPAEDRFLGEMARRFLQDGFIEPSTSDWRMSLTLARKSDGRPRICGDARGLNSVSRGDAYPAARVDEMIEMCCKKRFATVCDMLNGYFQLEIAAEDREKTAFAAGGRLWQWVTTTQGLKGAAASFQRALDAVLDTLGADRAEWCRTYLDDTLLASEDEKEHLSHLEAYFGALQRAGLTLSLKKCQFARTSVTLLGQVVDVGVGRRPGEDRVAALRDYPPPTDESSSRRLRGVLGFNRDYIQNYSAREKPIREAEARARAAGRWEWTDEADAAMRDLIGDLAQQTLLRLPDFDRKFWVSLDGSGAGLGASLLQRPAEAEDGGADPEPGPDGASVVPRDLVPVAYASWALTRGQQKYSATLLEALTIREAVARWHPYLHGRKFTVVTDHVGHDGLQSLKLRNPMVDRWCALLAAYEYDCVWRPGHSNVVADALSRAPGPGAPDASDGLVDRWASLGAATAHEAHGTDVEPQPAVAGARRAAVLAADADVEAAARPPPARVAATTRGAALSDALARAAGGKDEEDEEAGEEEEEEDGAEATAAEDEAAGGSARTRELAAAQAKDPGCRRALEHGSVLEHGARGQSRTVRRRGDGLVVVGADEALWLPAAGVWREEAMYEAHDAAGHFHAGKAGPRLRAHYFFPGWRKETERYVASCTRCAGAGAPPRRTGPAGSVAPARFNERLAVDFIGPFPASRDGNRHVLTCVDYMSRFALAIPTKTETAREAAEKLLGNWYCTRGPPEVLQSDRGAGFLHDFVAAINSMTRTVHKKTAAYNPAANGVCERFNGTLKKMLRKTIRTDQSDWDGWKLQVAVYSYNTAVHSTHGMTPFAVAYGQTARPLSAVGLHPAMQEDAAAFRRELEEARTKARRVAARLTKEAAEATLVRTDESSRHERFEAGDMVYVFYPSVAVGGAAKLALQWVGPLRVAARVSDTTYDIESYANKVVSTRVNVGRLKHAYVRQPGDLGYDGTGASGPRVEAPAAPEGWADDDGADALDMTEWEVDEILEAKDTADGEREYLVRWAGFSSGFNSWVKASDMGNAKELTRVFEAAAARVPADSPYRRLSAKAARIEAAGRGIATVGLRQQGIVQLLVADDARRCAQPVLGLAAKAVAAAESARRRGRRGDGGGGGSGGGAAATKSGDQTTAKAGGSGGLGVGTPTPAHKDRSQAPSEVARRHARALGIKVRVNGRWVPTKQLEAEINKSLQGQPR